MRRVVISSGHGKFVRGAEGILDEVDEARRVVDRVGELIRNSGGKVVTYHDDVSTSQNENLNRIVDFHNSNTRDLDVSVHFNSNGTTKNPLGTECLYVTQSKLAEQVSDMVSIAGGFIDRGAVYRDGLFFLNETSEPAILIETCFVNSEKDAELYRENFDVICQAIASAVADEDIEPGPDPEVMFRTKGPCSWFGGPNDQGVSPSEGLAFIYSYDQRPDLFLPSQPSGTTGLARRLDPDVYYVACRWDYGVTPKTMLDDKDKQALVRAGGRQFLAWPADWGPHENTGRVADLSPGLMEALGLNTDDDVEVIYPAVDEPPEPEPEPEKGVVKIEVEGDVEVWVNGVVVT